MLDLLMRTRKAGKLPAMRSKRAKQMQSSSGSGRPTDARVDGHPVDELHVSGLGELHDVDCLLCGNLGVEREGDQTERQKLAELYPEVRALYCQRGLPDSISNFLDAPFSAIRLSTPRCEIMMIWFSSPFFSLTL